MAENPLTGDTKLQGLLTKVDGLSSEKDFIKWKKSFLKVYTSYLDPNGVLNAQDANGRLLTKLTALSKRCNKVKSLIEDHNIHADQITAEGRRAVTNLSDELTKAEHGVSEFLPKTGADEEKYGYNKFELGAILIQDGFYGYDLMIKSRDLVQTIVKDNLQGLSDNANFCRIFQYYEKSIDVFVQVMEDLGLFQIMKQCVGVVYKDKKRKPPKAPEPSGSGEVTKTTASVTKPTKKTKKENAQGVEGGNGVDSEENGGGDGARSKQNKNGNGRKASTEGSGGMCPKPSSGLDGEENPENLSKEEQGDEKEAEEEKGEGGEAEFLFYFDPKTSSLGMINRRQCGEKSKLIVDLEKEGTDAYQNLVEDEKERQELIWLLKKLERTKPEEESWLEQIKRDKAAKKGEVHAKNNDRKKMPSSTNGAKRRISTQSISSAGSKDAARRDVSTKDTAGPGFRDPFGAVSSSSSKTKKKTVENYQGKYKKAAAKPDTGGWKKIS
ncbi:hypothetical protein IV203_013752 [Nitzschia inconspicua]|uniref:Uncharacterized protein n=1 Tax=Nitzschia inconspicua TaxID=303405 RepID=A0A9K3M638_9STRA|nr:hypothetical protein IV203_013752 [Nitzschia inconspicua]